MVSPHRAPVKWTPVQEVVLLKAVGRVGTFITNCPPSGMSSKQCTRIVLNERPITDITPTTFRTEYVPLDFEPGPGEVLVQVNWLSLDPAMRGWLRDARSYMPPVQVGEVMRSLGLATVVEAGEGCRLLPGDVVSCMPGG